MHPLESEFLTICRTSMREDWHDGIRLGESVQTEAGLRPCLVGLEGNGIPWPERSKTSWHPDTLVLVELISRTIAVRSRHFEESIGEAWFPDDWRDRLGEVFSVGDDTRDYFCFDHGPGWADLLTAAGEWTTEVGDPFVLTDAKEKWGRLALSGWQPDETIKDLDWHIEHVSGHICDRCGAPGRRETAGWMSTLCDAHIPKRRSK